MPQKHTTPSREPRATREAFEILEPLIHAPGTIANWTPGTEPTSGTDGAR